MTNSKRKRKLSHDRETSEDETSDIADKNSVFNHKNSKNNGGNDSDSSSSSDSSNSASSSSGSSSSSSSSEDEDDETNDNEKTDHAKTDIINGADLSYSLGSSSSRNLQCRSPQQEISTWNLTNFMDKKTIASSSVSSNSLVNKESVKITNDSINDVIDRVARGEIGENNSFDGSLRNYTGNNNVQKSPISKKKKKTPNIQPHQQYAHRKCLINKTDLNLGCLLEWTFYVRIVCTE